MRVIYVVRAFQLVMTVYALWLLYSVHNFCEKTVHQPTVGDCPDLKGIPLASPELNEQHRLTKHLRSANNRPRDRNEITSDATTPDHSTTAHESTTPESSTVSSSTEESAKSRRKRDERRQLPGGGEIKGVGHTTKKTEAAASAAGAAPAATTDAATPAHAAAAAVPATAATAPAPIEAKPEEATTHGEKVEGKQPESSSHLPEETTTHGGGKTSEKVAEQPPEKSEPTVGEERKESTSIETLTTVAKTDEEKGDKVEIPTMKQKNEERDSGRPEEAHHTVKKDLKAHVLHQDEEDSKLATTSTVRPPKLAPNHEKFVLEHADAFLQEMRCIEVTSDDYFGKNMSPYSAHLKGLVFVGPILVVTAIYLVCTVLRTRLCQDTPTEFTDTLGCMFHCAMWMVVGLSMFFIANHWTGNWQTISNGTFLPEFPRRWCCLILLSSLMMVVGSVETWFHKRLYYDIVFERSYRCYEVVENVDADALREDSFASTTAW